MDRFRFVNLKLQEQLRQLYEVAAVKHVIAENGALVCDDEDQARVEALRSAVRYTRFSGWRTACLPPPPSDGMEDDDAKALFAFLEREAIPFELEEHDDGRWLLLPDDRVIPDTVWEDVYGPISSYTRTHPKCGFCWLEIEGDSFGEISVRSGGDAFRAILYAHTGCLAKHLHHEALHILEAID